MPMPERWRQTFLAYAEGDEHARKVANARQRIAGLTGETIAVPFSGGKDSTALLHLIAQSGHAFIPMHFDFGRPGQKRHNAFPASLERAILDAGAVICGRPIDVATKRKYWRDAGAMWEERPQGTVIHIVPDGTSWITGSMHLARKLGATVDAVALRAEESATRRNRIRNRREIDGSILPEVWPISDWTYRDVWAYLITHDLPYPSLYDERAPVVGGYQHVRLTSLFRDPTEAKVEDGAIDGVLHWRLRGR